MFAHDTSRARIAFVTGEDPIVDGGRWLKYVAG